jgi:hypothetical protein
MMRLFLAVSLVGTSMMPADAADNFVCIGEKSTGFHREGSVWERASFRADDQFVISQGTSPNEFVIRQTGSEKIVHTCKRETYDLIGGPLVSPDMICGGMAFNFSFNFETLRFQQFYGIGYVGDTPNNTPYILIGKCTKL